MGKIDFFKIEKKEHDIYAIDAPLRVKSYVVLGKEKAMVIDTTNGIGSLMEKVREITDLPVIVVNTHGHPDHAGGNVEFDEIYMHPADDEVFHQMVTKEFRHEDVKAFMRDEAQPMLDALLDFKEDYIPMEDGQVFDLGGRTLRVIHTPGHTKGCCCLLDENTGLLFSGDTVSWAETWLYLDYSTGLETYLNSLKRLESMKDQFTGIIPSHTPEEVVPIPVEQITYIKECVEDVLAGTLVGERFETFAGVGMLARKGKGAIVYRPDDNAPFYLSDGEALWIKNTVDNMSVEEKVGQLFVILGDAYSEEERCELIAQKGIGGVLFRPDTKENIKKKFEQLEKLSKLPMLKAANLEEGGSGILTDGTYFGSQMQVAAANDEIHTRRFAKVCALEGREVGVNWTFSPVVDIDMNYQNPITNIRTFGSDKHRVADNASIFVEELQKLGVAACCKHFPGDGVDYRDQHLHPTYNDLSAKDWYESFGMVYKRLIDEGILGVMVGHIVAPNVIRDINPQATDADMLPASLSPEMLDGVLRKKYGFKGVIITDATIMGGYTMAMARKDALPRTIMSGCDMICFSTDIYEDMQYLLAAVEDGRLTMERLDEAVTRVLSLKVKTMKQEEQVEPLTMGACWADACASAAVTLVKDIQKLVPVSNETYPKVKLVLLGEDAMYDGKVIETAIAVLTEAGFEVEVYDPMADDLHGSSQLDQKQLTLILSNIPTAVSNKTAVRIFWCQKHALEIPRFVNEETTAFISLGNPYHLQDIPRVRTFINAYTATRATVRASLEKLIGKEPFCGVSPVDAFCGLYDTRL